MKKWEILTKFKIKSSIPIKSGSKFKIDDVTKALLKNRGIKTKKEIDEFLSPDIKDVTFENVGIDKKNLGKAIDRITKAIENKEEIAVFGDYDVDGICGTAILWETLFDLGAKVTPYIPHRIDEGYGLSEIGIKNLKLKIKNCSLIITVDNGIVAGEAVEFAKKKGIDVIITDHHVPSKKLPGAYAIVHSTKLCGAGVAWLLSKEIAEVAQDPAKRDVRPPLRHLELVALATVADLVPLIGANRTLTKFGIEELRQTKRVGLLAIIKEGGIEKKLIDVYQIGHIIGPRLNAMGRLEYAMDSLRLLCTKDVNRAKFLAEKLGTTNKRRQEMTVEAFEHAKSKNKTQKTKLKSLIFIEHESYEQGIIGLVAGRLVEEFYRPSIVVSRGKIYSKASARSVRGVNIIEFIRNVSELLVDAGGHPMAAGFTVETKKLLLLKRRMEELAEELFDEDKFRKILYIDLELPFSYINEKLDAIIQKLAPFGMGNPQPAFLTKKVIVEDMRLVGEDGKHLKLRVFQLSTTNQFDAIGFNMGEMSKNIRIGDSIDLVYQIERNKWNGNSKLQLKIKDLIKTN